MRFSVILLAFAASAYAVSVPQQGVAGTSIAQCLTIAKLTFTPFTARGLVVRQDDAGGDTPAGGDTGAGAGGAGGGDTGGAAGASGSSTATGGAAASGSGTSKAAGTGTGTGTTAATKATSATTSTPTPTKTGSASSIHGQAGAVMLAVGAISALVL